MKTPQKRFLKITMLTLAGLCLNASACQTGEKKSAFPDSSPGRANTNKVSTLPRLPDAFVGVVALTQGGENSSARLSRDGRRLVFISRLRPAHKQAQVYELLLPEMTERRLTFHDGDDLEPVIAMDGESFFYASSTDELKEENVASQKLMRSYYPEGLRPKQKDAKPNTDGTEILTEIYRQGFDGREITRLTHESGYDGDLDLEPTGGHHAVFTSDREGQPALYLADENLRNARRLSEKNQIERGARYSPDGKTLVWIRTPADDSRPGTRLMIADGSFRKPRELLNGGEFAIIHPAWHPSGNEIILSANFGEPVFNLYSIDREGKCLRRLTTSPSDQTQPLFGPEGKWVLFTGRKGETNQLFAVDYRPGPTCLPTSGPATSTSGPKSGRPEAPAPSPTERP